MVFDTSEGRGRVFQGVVPCQQVDYWYRELGDYLICHTKLYAIVALSEFFKPMLSQR